MANYYKNYTLLMSDKNEMYLYLNSRWFWVNKPGREESRARKTLPDGRKWRKITSLRKLAQEATSEEEEEYKDPTDNFTFNHQQLMGYYRDFIKEKEQAAVERQNKFYGEADKWKL